MRLVRAGGYLLGTLLALLSGTGQAATDEARIAVASNFTAVARELVDAFEASHRYRVRLSFGSTGKLYTQIYNGAPFDAFLAADEERPARAENEGLAVTGSRFTYATGKLALWSGRSGSGDALLQQLQDGNYQRLAIANPRIAPYGSAAQEVMRQIAQEDASARLVYGENIAQTYQFVATGNADLGFVALSQVVLRPEGSAWVVPETYYTPIRQQAVLLKSGAGSDAARAFLAYLQQDSALAIIRRHGYGT